MADRFLLVTADFVKTGGMDRANYALAEYLARQGREVHLVGHTAGAGLRERANVHWHPVPRPLGRDALGWGLLDRAGRRWARRISPGGPVVVNGGNCRWGDVNWVHYVHAAYRSPIAGNAARQAWQAYKHCRCLRDERCALEEAQTVIANSNRTRAELIERLGLSPERVHTIYYGCDPERFRPVTAEERQAARRELGWAATGRTALFIGALGDRRKGFDTLFAAWQRLCARPGWQVDLAVAGRGSELAAWRRRAAAAGIGHSCQFLGFRHDVPTLLAACDVLVSPARYEAFGLAAQEALVRGLPVVISAAAGVAERLPAGWNDLLVQDPESAEELEARLRWWEEHTAGLRLPLEELSARLRVHTWDEMSAEILALTERGAA